MLTEPEPAWTRWSGLCGVASNRDRKAIGYFADGVVVATADVTILDGGLSVLLCLSSKTGVCDATRAPRSQA